MNAVKSKTKLSKGNRLTIIADSNIAHLNDYFNSHTLGVPVTIIELAGRDIDPNVIHTHRPDALLVRSVTTVNATLLQNNSSIKFVGSATIGTDHIDLHYLKQREIPFANAAGCSKHSVVQYVVTAILRLHPSYWNQQIKLGIIGLGNIGSTLANYARDLNWQILGYDPLLAKSALNNSSMSEVMAHSDVVSLHVPLTTKLQSKYPTYQLINEYALSQMPVESLLINTSRGAVISEACLIEDIKYTQREVVLDVFEHEPVVSKKLLDHLAIATPHIAGYTFEGKVRGTQMVFEAFVTAFADILSTKKTNLMADLIPANAYRWQELIQRPNQLDKYYDIKADARLLTASINPMTSQVLGTDFDALRKRYALRREWLYDC